MPVHEFERDPAGGRGRVFLVDVRRGTIHLRLQSSPLVADDPVYGNVGTTTTVLTISTADVDFCGELAGGAADGNRIDDTTMSLTLEAYGVRASTDLVGALVEFGKRLEQLAADHHHNSH